MFELASEACDDVVVVGRDVCVVHRVMDSHAPDHLVRRDVDDVDHAPRHLGRPSRQSLRKSSMLLVDDDFIGPLRQRDLLNELQCLSVKDIAVLSCSFCAVIVESVGMDGQVVRVRAARMIPTTRLIVGSMMWWMSPALLL